jgi:hypothetical protein
MWGRALAPKNQTDTSHQARKPEHFLDGFLVVRRRARCSWCATVCSVFGSVLVVTGVGIWQHALWLLLPRSKLQTGLYSNAHAHRVKLQRAILLATICLSIHR